MFMQHAMPDGEEDLHILSDECPCGPVKRRHNGIIFLWHKSFDHREWWMGVEIMLGVRCKEHIRCVDRATYEVGKPHEHVQEPAPYYEYEHKK